MEKELKQFEIYSHTIIEAESLEDAIQQIQDQRYDVGGFIADELLSNAEVSSVEEDN